MIRTLPSYRALLAVGLLLLLPLTRADAQHDTRGRAFWITFMANYNGGFDPTEMRLYLASETPTTARVIYHLNDDTVTVPIPFARTAVEVDIALLFGPSVELGDGEVRAMKAIEVIADNEITCYGANIRHLSADAFLALPDDVLTTRYIVLAYPNAWLEASFGSQGEYDQPSQFAIVATEDGTTIRIDPAAQLVGRRQETFTITLDRGEVFNGQAVVARYQDVSGTEIRANKPIAVFAGNRRTSIPLQVGNFRDHLIEQLPPLEVWGREAIVTPHATVVDPSLVPYEAVVRVLAAFDDTRWQINGVDQTPLSKATSVEIPLDVAKHITASAPILVAQYEHSAGYDNSGPVEITLPGDPFMMLIPPTEQFDTAYAFQSVEYQGFEELMHFVNVVVPTPGIASLRLDGSPIVAGWQPTPKPGYSYAQVRVNPGAHDIRGDSAFGIFVYGFGPAISYGYPGGLLFRTLVHDFEPPDLEHLPVCLGMEGMAYDSRITDTGIDSLYALPSSRNVTITVDPFAPGADTVRYHAALIDPYNDGVVAVKAIDSAGRSRTMSSPLAGFTVRAPGMNGSVPVTLDTLRLFTRTDTCLTVMLENYGIFPQTVTSLTLTPPITGVQVTTAMPMVIAPGERVPITLCAGDWADTIAVTVIGVTNDCRERSVALLPIIAGIDSIPPDISSGEFSCGSGVVVTFTDRNAVGSKIRHLFVDTLINATEVRRGATPSPFVDIELAPIDPYRDVVYQVRVVDMAGNESVRRDTVGGFTLAVLDNGRDSVSERFGRPLRVAELIPGAGRCDSIVLHNYGARPLTVSTLRFRGNRGYSIPQAQLPFTIPPHSDRRLEVCVEAGGTGQVIDTLELADACGRADALVLRASVPGLTTTDRCESILSVVTSGATKRNFLALPHPNPATGATATVTFGLSRPAAVTLTLFDAQGTVVERLLDDAAMPEGITRIETLIGGHPAGVYYLRMGTPEGMLPAEKLVIHR